MNFRTCFRARALVALVALSAFFACASKQRRPANSDDAELDLAPEVSATCAQNLDQALQVVDAVEPGERVKPALTELGRACPDVLGDLGGAAAQAAELQRAERSALLAQAAAEALPPACVTNNPLAPAASMAWSCPPQDKLELADQLLQDLDAGTYLYMLAVRARLNARGVLGPGAEKLLDNLIMAAALEGEAAAIQGPVDASGLQP